jgi:hypothetical protein
MGCVVRLHLPDDGIEGWLLDLYAALLDVEGVLGACAEELALFDLDGLLLGHRGRCCENEDEGQVFHAHLSGVASDGDPELASASATIKR